MLVTVVPSCSDQRSGLRSCQREGFASRARSDHRALLFCATPVSSDPLGNWIRRSSKPLHLVRSWSGATNTSSRRLDVNPRPETNGALSISRAHSATLCKAFEALGAEFRRIGQVYSRQINALCEFLSGVTISYTSERSLPILGDRQILASKTTAARRAVPGLLADGYPDVVLEVNVRKR